MRDERPPPVGGAAGSAGAATAELAVQPVIKLPGTPSPGTQMDERMILRESFRYLEHAPVGIVVVHGDAHTVVHANAAFRQLRGVNDDAIIGRPIAEILDNSAADVPHTPPRDALIGLLDRVRNGQRDASDDDVNLNVSANVSVSMSMNASLNIGSPSSDPGVWRCMVWPVRWHGAVIDQQIVELWYSRGEEASRVQQREIAERLLLSALREQTLSDDNARLYQVASDARAVAEAAQVHAEQEQARAEGAQREAEAANASKSDFLATMSHELRTPLNAIGGYAQLMEMGLRGAVTAAQKVDLGNIMRSQAHLLGLINSILNYAKVEAGQITYTMQSVTLDDVVADAEMLVNPQIHARGLHYQHAHGIEGDTALRATPVRVKADADKLRQILVNLLTNAIKFTASGGQITVACRTEDAWALVSVCDTGEGIPASHLQSIFDPFVQVGRRLTASNPGLGLGLAISRDFAVGMGGDLTVESVEGKGSTFTIVLPLVT